MITVVGYMKVIPPGNTKLQKPLIIKNFIEGVNRGGDKGLITNTWNTVPCDVAVLQGFVHQSPQKQRHLMLRKNVYETQMKREKRTMIVDSSLFLFADPTQSKNYLRYGYDGIFPNTAEYCWDNPDPQRWQIIKKDLGIELKPWKKTGGQYILFCCQREGGWSMSGLSVLPWLQNTIRTCRQFSQKPIRIRFHPGDKQSINHKTVVRQWINSGLPEFKNIEISGAKDLRDELAHAHAVIGHNSSPTVASVIAGIPTLVTDPDRAQVNGVCLEKWDDIENPKEYDREKWIQKLAQIHWTLDEVKQGLAWQHLRNYVK